MATGKILITIEVIVLDNDVEFQIEKLVPLFISDSNGKFNEIVQEANGLVNELMQRKMRKTNSLLLAVLRAVLVEHGHKISAREVSDKTGEPENNIYQRERLIRAKGFTLTGSPRKKNAPRKRAPLPVAIKQEAPVVEKIPVPVASPVPIGGIEAYLEEKMVSVIDRFLGKKIAEIDRKLDMLVPAPVAIPEVTIEKPEVKRETQLAIIDLNHLINYFIGRNYPVDLEACIDALARSIKQECGDSFKLSSYMYLSRHYNGSYKDTAFDLVDGMINDLGITDPDLHVYVTEEKKGFLPSGTSKFQDVDVYIVDKTCEIFLTRGNEIKTVHIVSGDIDMLPVVKRAISKGIKVKLVSFDNAISRRLSEEAGPDSVVTII